MAAPDATPTAAPDSQHRRRRRVEIGGAEEPADAVIAGEGARAVARRERRRRMEEQPEAPTAPTERVHAASDPPVASAPTSVPRVGGAGLPEEERRLLHAPLELDSADIYPAHCEPQFLSQPRAPAIDTADDRFVELAGTRQFKRLGWSDPFGPSRNAQRDKEYANLERPSGATQLLMLLLGTAFYVSQGALAGVSLMQVFSTPRDKPSDLTAYMAYAPLAMPLQTMAQILTFLSFLGACDVYASARRTNRNFAAGAIWLYALVALALAIQLPTDVALDAGRDAREPAIEAQLDAAGGDPIAYEEGLSDLPSMDLESGGSLTTLSATRLEMWEALIITRAALSILAWGLLSLEHSPACYGAPPVAGAVPMG